MMEDPAMKDMDMPFDGKRMIYGGFATAARHRRPLTCRGASTC